MSPLGGLGVYAAESLPASELVAVLGGKVLTAAEVEALSEVHPEYLWKTFSVWEGLYFAPFEPNPPVDDTELFNHSCDPNAGILGQVILVARRPIAVGEEVTFDYNTTETEVIGGFECRCGSQACRGVVDGQAWRDPSWRERNAGYLSTYIGEKVRRELHPRG